MNARTQYALGLLSTPIFLPIFLSIFLLFHLPFLIAEKLSSKGVKKLLEWFNLSFLLLLRSIGGVRIKIHGQELLPSHGPAIIVSNHQSIFDIPLIIWYLRDLHPAFIAKQELGQKIPSVSVALRAMGSVLIDRKNRQGSLLAIRAFAAKMREDERSAVIFPEGTRARDGIIKQFKVGGFVSLLHELPEVPVVPVAIDGSWKLVKHSLFPLPFGVTINVTILPSRVAQEDPKQALEKIQQEISQTLTHSS